MQKFIVFYKGPATAPDASHAGWPEWFGKLENHLIDRGSPLLSRFSVHHDGSFDDSATEFNGYSIIQAEDHNEVRELLQDHPYLALGTSYSIEVFELP